MTMYRVLAEEVWKQAYLVEASSEDEARKITNVRRFQDHKDDGFFEMDQNCFEYSHSLPVDDFTVVENLDEEND